MFGTAMRIASQVHEKQKDKGGNSYILHPIRIAMRLRTTDEELMQIAILHDVVEDSNVTIDFLKKEGFSDRVLVALDLLTHKCDDSYEEYIEKISKNVDAIKIKLEDLRDNSDITRLKGLSVKDFKRMEKYHRSYVFLRSI